MKPRICLIALITVTILGIAGFRFGEDPQFIKTLRSRLDKYNMAMPSEKVYLQLDKPFYKPGETIWFNAFALSGTTHTPMGSSDVLYVNLIDPKGNVAMTRELLIRGGTAHGEFTLPESNPGGIYEIKAYTRWMQNFGDSSVFAKKIQVQKVITPRLLFKLDFERKAYGPADSVAATLQIRDLKDEPVAHAEARIVVSLAGKRFQTRESISDTNGNLTIGFTLPDSLNSSDGLLQVLVTHRGLTESISRAIPIVLNKIDLTFYPEGGYAIAGTKGKIAFKAVNEFGKGADVEGVIVDESNSQVGSFKSSHLGMGAFSFTPQSGKQYFAIITSPSGNNNRYLLPKSLPSGFGMNLNDHSDQSVSWNIYSSQKSSAYLVAHSHGILRYTAAINLSKGNNTIAVPIKDFPSGISVFTLFDEHGLEQCERLVYIQSKHQLNISLSTAKKQYHPGENVELTIRTTDGNGDPIPAKLSLAVADDQLISFADDRQDNLLSYMYLSSEVRGKIEEPSFYFNAKEPKASVALDYLLMTQGWRRFTWSEVRKEQHSVVTMPEKIRTIYGKLTDKNGNPIAGEVTLMELGNLKRVLTIQTRDDGRFIFQNTDPTIPTMLLAGRNTNIQLEEKSKLASTLAGKNPLAPIELPQEIAFEEKAVEAEDKAEADAGAIAMQANLNFSLHQDANELSEVIVIGYGAVEKKSLTGALITVDNRGFNLPSVEYALQGRVAGVFVSPPGNPGAASLVRIRGANSFANSGDPLYVIDGQPVIPTTNNNFSVASLINPNDISSIHVLRSPEAGALFGGAAANGVILITTRSSLGWGYVPISARKSNFIHTIRHPRVFSPVKEFYQDRITTHAERKNFESLLYWDPDVKTNDKGIAKVSFRSNDLITTFRMTVEGFAADGLLGRAEETFYSQLPFSVDTRLPDYLGFEDTLKLPVQIRNEKATALEATIKLQLPGEIHALEPAEQLIVVAPGSVGTFTYTLIPQGVEGTFPIKVVVDAENRSDAIEHSINVKPTGFPVQLSFSGQKHNSDITFNIRDAEKGTLSGSFSAYPNILSDLMTGVESIFREPHGCFEQTSATTFPNILALQFMRNTGTSNPEIEARALKYIRNGYNRLRSFEVKGGGFDWFGKPPSHEALTAYGLFEFIEMQKVFPDVDEQMIERTRKWLLSRRTGKGTYKLYEKGLDDFSRPSGYVSNAYITYALSETGFGDLETEYKYALESAWQSKDLYQLALVANTAFNLNKMDDYAKLMHHFERTVDLHQLDQVTASHSVVRSAGISLTNEVVALWAIAMTKSGRQKLPQVKPCIDYLISKRTYGGFGSTQSTVLALKALVEYANLMRAVSHPGTIQLLVNGRETERHSYQKTSHDEIVLTRFTESLTSNGSQRITINFQGTPEPLPYSLNLKWYTKTPISAKECSIDLTTTLDGTTVRLNETIRLAVRLRNTTNQGASMTLASIGIPAGLSVQPWQLKELQEKGTFDFYEITDGKLVLYYRQMQPNEIRNINLDLKAELQGSFVGSASSAYLYYTNEFKKWTDGLTIKVI